MGIEYIHGCMLSGVGGQGGSVSWGGGWIRPNTINYSFMRDSEVPGTSLKLWTSFVKFQILSTIIYRLSTIHSWLLRSWDNQNFELIVDNSINKVLLLVSTRSASAATAVFRKCLWIYLESINED